MNLTREQRDSLEDLENLAKKLEMQNNIASIAKEVERLGAVSRADKVYGHEARLESLCAGLLDKQDQLLKAQIKTNDLLAKLHLFATWACIAITATAMKACGFA